MPILALEFSSPRRTVAVIGPSGQALSANSDTEKSTRAFALIEDALQRARVDRAGITQIVVGLGPGSYTGIRVAIAIAQAWQFARGVNLLGISSAEVLAETARQAGLAGVGTLVIDAQRNEFYVAVCDFGAIPARITQPLHIETAKQIAERAERRETIFGPESLAPARQVFPDALVLAKLAAPRQDFLRGQDLQPIYLRETTFVKSPPPRFSQRS